MEDNRGTSFADLSLALNTAADAARVIAAIASCPSLEYFNLQGNTLGIEAAKAIGDALAIHGSKLTQAMWQDMFTGRLKSEIPIVLEHLSAGLLTANTRLQILDLSNNAFGPIGMTGLVNLLNSPVCYELQTLRLMNNGLGISGAKMLAKALIDNYEASCAAGTPFALKVLVAGRNRLENDGIIALSRFFSRVKTMEEIIIPQNGIYRKGILALTESLLENPNLVVLDVQDNILTPLGAEALANVLPKLEKLKRLNIADCLIKSRGALAISEALTGLQFIENLDVSYNEINGESGLKLTQSLLDKTFLREYSVNGNRFGIENIDAITLTLKELLKKLEETQRITNEDKDKILGSFSGDEGECSSSDEEDNAEPEESSSDEEEEEENNISVSADKTADILNNMTVGEVKLSKDPIENINFDTLVDQLMDTAGSYQNSDDESILSKCFELYKTAYSNATKTLKFVELTNLLLVKHGLIKSEDKTFQLRKDVGTCLEVLKKAIENKNVIPEPSQCVLSFMLKKKYCTE